MGGNPEIAFMLMETFPIAIGLTITVSVLPGSHMEAAAQKTLTEQLYKERSLQNMRSAIRMRNCISTPW